MPYGSYLYAATAVVLLAEIVLGRHRAIYRREDWLVGLGCIAANALTRPVAALLIASIAAIVLPQHKSAFAGISLWWTFPLVFALNEFAFYWGHRIAHEVKGTRHDWLWKLHRTHHSGKFINVTVTLRINAFWTFVVPTAWVLGIATYLGMGAAAGLALLVMYGWNLITHSHFRWDDVVRRHPIFGKAFRALEHVIVSPGMHHSHHGYGKDGGNFRNYAVTLAIWDWMFGTLHIPDGRPWRYGVPGRHAHWAEEILFPLVRDNGKGGVTTLPRLARPATSEQRTG